jgi:hypothetical protein
VLVVAIAMGAAGFTLMYAGIKGGPHNAWARQPWLLVIAAAKSLKREADAMVAANRGSATATAPGGPTRGATVN